MSPVRLKTFNRKFRLHYIIQQSVRSTCKLDVRRPINLSGRACKNAVQKHVRDLRARAHAHRPLRVDLLHARHFDYYRLY